MVFFSSAAATSFRHSMLHSVNKQFTLRMHPACFVVVRGGGTCSTSDGNDGSTSNSGYRHRVYLAVGSNLGDRFNNIRKALALLCDERHDQSVAHLVRTSFLHETAPMYVTDQPAFLNGAVELETDLEPPELLRRIKDIESKLGRDMNGTRNGPRPVDLDILLYESREVVNTNWTPSVLESDTLQIPHPRMQEREFVLASLCEVAGRDLVHPGLNTTIGELFACLKQSQASQAHVGPPAVRALPLPRGRMLYFNETIIMGILNFTPDSFSDGGKWTSSVDRAVQRALEMEREGARIIDVGGESTRPGAEEVAMNEELERTIPVIEGIRKVSDVPISIDTRRSEVAKAAIKAGADIVNDVSGGTFDPAMLGTISELGVPVVLMHMRGSPQTMQSLTEYSDVVTDVATALLERSKAAEQAGIPRWIQIVDPGIGFAKDMKGNLLLLKNMSRLRSAVADIPILLGTSRKGFIGRLTGVNIAEDRDYGSVASYVAPLCLENGSQTHSIIRTHNVAAAKQATSVMDAIKNVR